VREDGPDDLLATAVERLPPGLAGTASIRRASSPWRGESLRGALPATRLIAGEFQ
jgi:hypothetical protein